MCVLTGYLFGQRLCVCVSLSMHCLASRSCCQLPVHPPHLGPTHVIRRRLYGLYSSCPARILLPLVDRRLKRLFLSVVLVPALLLILARRGGRELRHVVDPARGRPDPEVGLLELA